MKAFVVFILVVVTTLNLQANINKADGDSCKKCGIIVWSGEKASFEKTIVFDQKIFSVDLEDNVSFFFTIGWHDKQPRSISSKLGVFIFDQPEKCIYVIRGFYGMATYILDIIEPNSHIIHVEFDSLNDYFDLMENLNRLNKNMISELREARLKNQPESK